LFRKIEPYLTFLNIHQLEKQGADIQSKVQELEDLNSSLRERDRVKDDAIAHLVAVIIITIVIIIIIFLNYYSLAAAAIQ
jgi:hypothetical protein